jgi:hypothetical protein
MGSKTLTFKDHLEAAISLENRAFSRSAPSEKSHSPSGNAQFSAESSTLPLWILVSQSNFGPISTRKAEKSTVNASQKAKFNSYKVFSRTAKTAEPLAAEPKKPATTAAPPKPTIIEESFAIKLFSPEAALALAHWGAQKVLVQNLNEITWSTVKGAYRKLALQNHPDRWPDLPEAHERFVACQAEYEILKKEFRKLKTERKSAAA